MKPPSLVFGVLIDDVTMPEAIDEIGELVRDGRRSGRTHQIATVNVDFLVNALADPDLRAVLQTTSLNLADGRPLLWGGRATGLTLRERVTGADLVPALAATASQNDWKVHFLGGATGVAERALTRMDDAHPGARLTADGGGRMTDVADPDDPVVADAIATIRRHDPDVLCVALGNPKQELFIAAHRERLGVPVMIGIGGSLDMYVGDKKRAPLWAQRAGAEFLFRAAQEPARLGRRYAHDARVFGPRFARYAQALRRHRRGPSLTATSTDRLVTITVDAGPTADPRPEGSDLGVATPVAPAGDIDLGTVHGDIVAGADLRVDLAGTVPHPRAITEWMAVERIARRHGRRVVVDGVIPPTRRVLVDSFGLPAAAVDGSDRSVTS